MITLDNAELGFWIALTIWVVAFLFCLYALVFSDEKKLRLTIILAAVGLLPHLGGVAARWVASGRPPFINLYELVAASAWVTIATFLVAQAVWKAARPSAVVVLPVAFLSMGAVLTLSTEANLLSPALKSWWLVIHIIFALVAHGCFAIASGTAVLIFVPKRETPKSLVPSPEQLDRLCARLIIFGFICHTLMLLSGAIWANRSWGRFWGWDPIETWSLFVWLLYGLYAHLRLLPMWRGRPAAAYVILAFFLVVFSFWGVPHLYTSVHDYTLYAQ